jgi:hypothetical protein
MPWLFCGVTPYISRQKWGESVYSYSTIKGYIVIPHFSNKQKVIGSAFSVQSFFLFENSNISGYS